MDQALRDFTLPGRAILGYVADRHLSSLDLEEFTLTPLPELRLLGTSDGREFYLGRKTEEGISCAHWKDGALRTVKDIPSDFSTNEQPILHGHGFLISQGGRIRIIGYPDLEEIRFKGLKMRR